MYKPWSKYSYETKDGPLQGNLAIKGTIDLITQPSENTLEIVDWKTGRRLDWATGQEKTQEKLRKTYEVNEKLINEKLPNNKVDHPRLEEISEFVRSKL